MLVREVLLGFPEIGISAGSHRQSDDMSLVAESTESLEAD